MFIYRKFSILCNMVNGKDKKKRKQGDGEDDDNAPLHNFFYSCPWEGCESSFTSQQSLKSHIRYHRDVDAGLKYHCSECSTSSYRQFNVMGHITKKHRGNGSVVYRRDGEIISPQTYEAIRPCPDAILRGLLRKLETDKQYLGSVCKLLSEELLRQMPGLSNAHVPQHLTCPLLLTLSIK